jgi:cyclase
MVIPILQGTQKRLIPILLIREGGLMKSSNFQSWTYVGDIINTAKIFNDKDVDELIILDTQASSKGSGPNLDLIEQVVSECFLPISYGGGVRSLADARELVRRGVDKVVLNSEFLKRPSIVKEISEEIGTSSTVVSIDAQLNKGKYLPYSHLEIDLANRPLDELMVRAELEGAGEIVIQSVDQDGTKSGPDIELARFVLETTDLPLVYAGGVASLEHASMVWNTGIDAVAAGSWFVFNGAHDAVLVTYPRRSKIRSAIDEI